MECISDITFSKWLAGKVLPAQRPALELHVEQCATCRATWAALVHDSRASEAAPPAASQQASIDAAARRYELHEELVRGGMGRILRAHDRVLGRDVALKCLREDRGEPARFAQEIAVLSKLSHPAIVAIFDSGWLAPNYPFFAMPLLQGETLDHRLHQNLDTKQRVALVRRLAPVVNAVAYAHSRGVLHRDVKPQNIFLGRFDESILLDWGLAKETEHAAPSRASLTNIPASQGDGLTRAGMGMGTLGYSAPEQLAGEPVDERVDVFALGAVLYHVLTGQVPAAVAQPVQQLAPDVPADLASVVMRALSIDRAARYPSARELASELERFFAGMLVAAHSYTPSEIVWRWIKKHRTLVTAGALAAVVMAVSVTVAGLKIRNQRDVAVAEQQRALTARRKTQTLTSFVLVDVQAKFAQLGRLDLMNDLATATADYLADPNESHSDVSTSDARTDVINQARLQQMLGDVAQFRGQYRNALVSQQHAKALLEKAATVNEPLLVDRCGSHLRIAKAQRSLGAIDDAVAELHNCQQLVGDAPDSIDLAHSLADTYAALGDVARDHADPRTAVTEFRRAVAVLQPKLAAAAPAQRQQSGALFASFWVRLASAYATLNEFDHASEAGERALREAEQFAKEFPTDLEIKKILVGALVTTAQQHTASQHREDVPKLLQQALALIDPIIAADPSNIEQARRRSVIWQLQAEYADTKTSGELLHKCFDQSRAALLVAESPRSLKDVVSDGVLLARWLREANQLREAAEICDEALRAARRLHALPTSSPSDTNLVATLINCGDIDNHNDNDSAATAKFVEGVQVARRAHAADDNAKTRYWWLASLSSWLEDIPVAEAKAHLDELAAAIAALQPDAAGEGNTDAINDGNELLERLRHSK
jgi:tetratricopeptide (TPR) repeat protein